MWIHTHASERSLLSSPNTPPNRLCVKWCIFITMKNHSALSLSFSYLVVGIRHFLQTAMLFRHYPISNKSCSVRLFEESGCCEPQKAVIAFLSVSSYTIAGCQHTAWLYEWVSRQYLFLFMIFPLVLWCILQIWAVNQSVCCNQMQACRIKHYSLWCSRTPELAEAFRV